MTTANHVTRLRRRRSIERLSLWGTPIQQNDVLLVVFEADAANMGGLTIAKIEATKNEPVFHVAQA